jgi:hypothetical protein
VNQKQYDEMVGLIETWWGSVEVWQGDLWPLFAELPADPVFEVLTGLRDGGRYPDFPPKPPALRAAVLDRLRHDYTPPRALPEPERERYDWAEYSRRVYGEVISLAEAVRISNEAQLVGVAAPSLTNPWRRPDSPQDGSGGPEPSGPDLAAPELPSDDQRAIYRPVREIEPPEVLS